MVGRRRDRADAGGQTAAGAAAVAAAAESPVAGAGDRVRGAAGVQLAAWPLVADPMDFVTRTLPYIFGTRDYFNSSIEGNGSTSACRSG